MYDWIQLECSSCGKEEGIPDPYDEEDLQQRLISLGWVKIDGEYFCEECF